MTNEWMQFLTPETQALLAKSTQSNDVIRPAQAQGTDFSKFSSPVPVQEGSQTQRLTPVKSGFSPPTSGDPGYANAMGYGSTNMKANMGQGSGALGLGNGNSMSDLVSAFSGGTLNAGQGLGSLFSLIGL